MDTRHRNPFRDYETDKNQETYIDMGQNLLHERRSLTNSMRETGRNIEIGENVLQNLFSQRDKLHSSSTRLGSVASTLGVSDKIVARIEARIQQDKYILLALGFALILVVILSVYFFRKL